MAIPTDQLDHFLALVSTEPANDTTQIRVWVCNDSVDFFESMPLPGDVFQSLRVGLIFVKDAFEPSVPLAQSFVLGVCDIPQIGFGHGWNGVWCRQGVQQHPGILGNDPIKTVAEISA